MASTVYVVHCIDTEGPLYESVEATFERLKAIFKLDLEPSVEMLRRLQAGEVDLGGMEAAVRKVVDPHLLAYNDTWDKVDAMLEDCLVRRASALGFATPTGGGWIYNWFCVDHVDYEINPRRRDMGYHNVFDHYRGVIRETNSERDGLHFHYHPHSFRKEAHRCATHWWASSDSLSPDPLAAGDRAEMVSGRPSPGIPRDPSGQPLVPRAVHSLRLLQPGDGPDRRGQGAVRLDGRSIRGLATSTGELAAVSSRAG